MGKQGGAETERYEPYCGCLNGHVTMIPDPNGRWGRADEGWQDISTARKDGTRVLAYYSADGGVYDIYWDAENGWVSHDYEITNFHQPDFTHWMPRPPDPTDPRAVADDPSGIVQQMTGVAPPSPPKTMEGC